MIFYHHESYLLVECAPRYKIRTAVVSEDGRILLPIIFKFFLDAVDGAVVVLVLSSWPNIPPITLEPILLYSPKTKQTP
jgi:hypothetical protein